MEAREHLGIRAPHFVYPWSIVILLTFTCFFEGILFIHVERNGVNAEQCCLNTDESQNMFSLWLL